MRYPALEVRGIDGGLVLAAVDDHTPLAAEDIADGIRIFFPNSTLRDAARAAVARTTPAATLTVLDVDDEDWARRSQENLEPVTVGRLTIHPARPAVPDLPNLPTLVIVPSTGFGTGHHWTTRFCLQVLQEMELDGKTVLDVGTGSGILAMAARLLGARHAIGIDNDEDAIGAARENLARTDVDNVLFEVADLSAAGARLPLADAICANLTCGLLRRSANVLQQALRPDGLLIVSGLLAEERDEIVAAYADLEIVTEACDQEWAGLVFRRRPR